MERDRDRSRSPDDRKKKKKKKSRYRSSSSGKSSSEDERKKNVKKSSHNYEEELEKFKEEHRRRKEIMKANETPEQKKQRRLLKKETKERKHRLAAGASELGYSNNDNPFGDTQLTASFVWKKKHEQDGFNVKDIGSAGHRKRQIEKQEEMRIELEKVKKRKADRELEKMARDEEMNILQREKEAAMFSSWEKQEDDFHLHQARLRSSIRIRDGRAKPIDLLAAYINPEEEELEIQMHEPYTALIGLSIDDLEDLLEDIKIYITIDKKVNTEFWEDITIIVKDELEKLKRKRSDDSLSSRREVINPVVQKDVQKIFQGKTYAQLQILSKQMKDRIKKGGSIDVGYWESLLQQSHAFMAKARLKELHQKFLKRKLDELKMETTTEDDTNQQGTLKKNVVIEKVEKETNESDDAQPGPSTEDKEEEEETEEVDQKIELQKLSDAELREQAIKEFYEHAYNPKLLNFGEVEQEKWVEPDNDIQKLGYLREQVKSGSTVDEELEADSMFNTEVLRGMNENEEAFNTQVSLTSKKYHWSDKYRPRKPRFFNRVHTGYEWNKYNQTHYDQDNPPPKIVQGYKFNIFYPDLIDKTTTPEYTLTACENEEEFAILRFKAGPPYEDIAFKVVDREWECSNKHGFRCQFYNNIFQLYFHFKRYRYRR